MDIPIEAPRTKAEKDKAAELAITSIEKAYGKGSVFSLHRNVGIQMPHIPTGIWSLDNFVLGVGGAPRGRILEFYGPESSGKTTLALQIVAQAQGQGGRCAFIDAENALDPQWAEVNGVNTKTLTVSQPDTGEEGLTIAQILIESGAYDVIVIDSVAALVPKAELEGEIGDSLPGLQARMMSQAMRILSGKVRKSQGVVIFINQIREKIGVMFGSPETTTGGKALKFYASVRLDIRKVATLKDGKEGVPYGNRVKITAKKNKVGSPYRVMEVDLLFNRGFNVQGDLLDSAASSGIIDKSGAWYSFHDERMGQGRDNAVEALMNNGKWEESIKQELQEKRNKELAATAAGGDVA